MPSAIIESTAKVANRTLRSCKLKHYLKRKPRTSLILIMSPFTYKNLTPLFSFATIKCHSDRSAP